MQPTFRNQSEYLWAMRNRAKMADGTDAAETYVLLKAEDLEILARVAMRLERMIPYEDAIKRLVTGR